MRGEHGHAGALAVDLQLLDGVGALEVAGHQQGAVALGLEPLGQLAGEGGLAGTLEAGEHDDGGPVLARRIRRVSPPRISTSSSLTIFTICWLGFSAPETSAPRARSRTRRGELPHHGHGDVGVQQGTADLADRGVNVRLGQAALAAEVLEGCCQPVRE